LPYTTSTFKLPSELLMLDPILPASRHISSHFHVKASEQLVRFCGAHCCPSRQKILDRATRDCSSLVTVLELCLLGIRFHCNINSTVATGWSAAMTSEGMTDATWGGGTVVHWRRTQSKRWGIMSCCVKQTNFNRKKNPNASLIMQTTTKRKDAIDILHTFR